MEKFIPEFLQPLIHWISTIVIFMLQLDKHLVMLSNDFGAWTLVILFFIIFAETGLIVFPFLPGDSLLFAAGAVCALEGSALRVELLIPTLIIAGILGDSLNYSLGKLAGPKVFTREKSFFLNRSHLDRTREFYAKYGSSTIVICRFVPIIRTFAPFVAGIGQMNYARFLAYNVAGSIIWVVSLVIAGYIFGNLPIIQRNFHVVIFAIIGISLLPMVLAWLKAKRGGLQQSSG